MKEIKIIYSKEGDPIGVDLTPADIEKMPIESFMQVCNNYMLLLDHQCLRKVVERLTSLKDMNIRFIKRYVKSEIETLPLLLNDIKTRKSISENLFTKEHIFFLAYSLIEAMGIYKRDGDEDDEIILRGQMKEIIDGYLGEEIPLF